MKEYEVIEENGIEYNVFTDSRETRWRLSSPGLLLSRINGPAVIRSTGENQYWLNGLFYPKIISDEEWLLFQIIT